MNDQDDTKSGNLADTSEEDPVFVPLQETSRPLLLALRVFGLYHDPSEPSKIAPEHSFSAHRSGVKHTTFTYISTAYSGIITLVLLLNILRYIPAFFVGHEFNSELTVFRVIVAGYFFNCFLNTAILFFACHKSDRLNAFFGYYNKISTDEIARKLKIRTSCPKLRRRVLLISLIAVGLVLLNTGGGLYVTFYDIKGGSATTFTNPFPTHFTTLAMVSIVTLYCSAAWIIPVVFITTFASVLRYQLGVVTESIKDLMDTREKCVIKRLNDFRIKHLHFTRAIGLLDRDFKYLFATSYISSLWLCCFILYQLINSNDLPTVSAIIYGTWLASYLLIVISISIAAAHVNGQVC